MKLQDKEGVESALDLILSSETRDGQGRNGGNVSGRAMSKFMLSLRADSMRVVSMEARARGISIQELIRAVIIPDWVKENVRRDSRSPLDDLEPRELPASTGIFRPRR